MLLITFIVTINVLYQVYSNEKLIQSATFIKYSFNSSGFTLTTSTETKNEIGLFYVKSQICRIVHSSSVCMLVKNMVKLYHYKLNCSIEHGLGIVHNIPYMYICIYVCMCNKKRLFSILLFFQNSMSNNTAAAASSYHANICPLLSHNYTDVVCLSMYLCRGQKLALKKP